MGQLHIESRGSVSACPDTAHVHCNVLTKDGDMEKALKSNNEATAKALDSLQDLGIDAKQYVQTTGFRASPVYKQEAGGRRSKRIDHFQVSNTLNVKVRTISSLGKILTKLGSDEHTTVRLSGFANSQADELLDKARTKAVTTAIQRAKLYAEAAGISLEGITSISEGYNGHMEYGMDGGVRAMAAGGDATVLEGEQDHAVNITVVFATGNETPKLTMGESSSQ